MIAITDWNVDQLQVKGRCDVPMGEFWLNSDEWTRWDSRETASGAHYLRRCQQMLQ